MADPTMIRALFQGSSPASMDPAQWRLLQEAYNATPDSMGAINDAGAGVGYRLAHSLNFTAPDNNPQTGNMLVDSAPIAFGLLGATMYHSSPADFEAFKPSWRGASYFSPNEEGARKGASSGRMDLAHLYAPSETRSAAPEIMYKVQIPDEKIEGLHFTPKEKAWFDSLPKHIKNDDDLRKALVGSPMVPGYWDMLYEEHRMPDGTYEYFKRSEPPSISYEQAIQSGRDVYGQQHAHYNDNMDEAAAAEKTRAKGMGAYLMHDEGGLSAAVVDPSVINILRKYGLAGLTAGLGGAAAMSGASPQPSVRDSIKQAMGL